MTEIFVNGDYHTCEDCGISLENDSPSAYRCNDCWSNRVWKGMDVKIEVDPNNPANLIVKYIPAQALDYIQIDFTIDMTYATKCECGSEKCKLPTHSSWCPKYNGQL